VSALLEHHRTLTHGVGKCSLPMWIDGMPAGFCDAPAYGNPTTEGRQRTARWENGRAFPLYIPALACPAHGGPALRDVAHLGDPCRGCGVAHDDVASGPCPSPTLVEARNDR
jgi:hypothetical protein